MATGSSMCAQCSLTASLAWQVWSCRPLHQQLLLKPLMLQQQQSCLSWSQHGHHAETMLLEQKFKESCALPQEPLASLWVAWLNRAITVTGPTTETSIVEGKRGADVVRRKCVLLVQVLCHRMCTCQSLRVPDA
jgi:hypothetical protein